MPLATRADTSAAVRDRNFWHCVAHVCLSKCVFHGQTDFPLPHVELVLATPSFLDSFECFHVQHCTTCQILYALWKP